MKKMMMMFVIALPMLASAKVADFNAMIKENQVEQTQLHQDVQSGMDQGRVALEASHDSNTFADNVRESHNVPTNSRMLRFKKELISHNVNEKADQKRVANEIKSADREF